MAYQPKSYRKFLAGSVSAAVVASALAAPAGAAAASASFPDVPTGHWAYNEITALADKGIINGYSDGSFKPSQLLNRGQAAVLFTNALGLEVPENLNVFKDLKSTSYFAQYAAAVEANGVFGGYANGNFGAGDNLTREQMASVLVRAFDLKDTGEAVNVADLSKAHASHQANVKILVQNGVSVVSDNNFRPKETVSRAQFATFLYRAMVLTGKINENADVVSVKAINATTVEVKMAGEVKDVEASDFTIDGLTVSNAAVKQTDNTTVVLTTSAQEGKEYTLKIKGETAGKFTGVSAVVPSAVKMTTASTQGVIGNEVTLKAQVTVADGQSKAGIPVTFNIVNSSSNNEKIEVEALTDENGVATYSYTRYYGSTDTVTAYATSKSSVHSTGKVYWANAAQLTVKDVTEGSTLVNGTNKVYEINSTKNAGKYVFVTFKENLDVTPDKLTKTVTPQGVTTHVLDSDGDVTNASALYPYETTTGGKAVTAVKLDSKGKANLVLSGSDASVTPVVFEGTYTGTGSSVTDYKAEYSATALQAEGSTVKFELKHQLGLTLEAVGNKNAATYLNGTETGGRDYKLTYVDKDGKAVAAGTKVKVAIDKTGINGTFTLLDSNGTAVTGTERNGKIYYEVTVGKDGQATFTVASTRANDYVTPVVFIDNGKTANELDTNDLQATAEITYFVDEVTYTAQLVALGSDGKAAKPVLANNSDYIEFVYELVDQNGKTRRASSQTEVTFNVTAGAGALVVDNTINLAPGQSRPVTKTIAANATEASIQVKAESASSAYVTATGSRAGVVLPTTNPTSVTGTFLSTSELIDGKTYAGANVVGVDKDANTVTLAISGKNHTVSYGSGNLYIGGASKTIVDFEAALSVGDVVTYVPGTTPYFDITTNNPADTTAPTATVAYTAEVPAVTTNAYATDTVTDSGKDLVFTATEYGSEYNGIQVKLLDNNNGNTSTTASLDQVSGKYVINVDLSDDGAGAITADFDDVVAAVNNWSSTTKVRATVASADATTVVTQAATATLANGSKATPAENAKLTVTFNEAIANPSAVTVSAPTGKTLGTSPVFNWNDGKTVLTVTLGSDASTFTSGDVITVSNAKDASGNTQVLTPALP
ncbi:S-layer homology domain-containing protein [Bacillus infantis]|uniref:S-layer homology domain-containing protein n=1 Tax=Bacillus infantis TaxID=324767 RepID=UPI003CF34D43